MKYLFNLFHIMFNTQEDIQINLFQKTYLAHIFWEFYIILKKT